MRPSILATVLLLSSGVFANPNCTQYGWERWASQTANATCDGPSLGVGLFCCGPCLQSVDVLPPLPTWTSTGTGTFLAVVSFRVNCTTRAFTGYTDTACSVPTGPGVPPFNYTECLEQTGRIVAWKYFSTANDSTACCNFTAPAPAPSPIPPIPAPPGNNRMPSPHEYETDGLK